jgi:hypothetical protein
MAEAAAPVSLRLPRGPEAPRLAREAVFDRFADRLGRAAVYDVALVVSELVTTSVQDPEAGDLEEVGLDVGLVDDHVLIAVSDRGAQIVPRRFSRGTAAWRSLGLLLVDRLAGSWGVARDGTGRTRVWCELPLEPQP